MAVWFRVSLFFLLISLLFACGGEDQSRPDPLRSSGATAEVPQPGMVPEDSGQTGDSAVTPPLDEPPVVESPEIDPPVVIPPSDAFATHIFFPATTGMTLHFDNLPGQTVQGSGQLVDSDLAYPLQYADVLSNFFTSTPDMVGLKGFYGLLLQYSDPVFLDITFINSRPILGDAHNYSVNGQARVVVDGGLALVFTLPVRVVAHQVADEWVEIPGMGLQPARRVEISISLAPPDLVRWLILGAYPWLAPLFDPITYSLQLVPGVGVVGIQFNDQRVQAEVITGVDTPLVFSIHQNGSLGEPQSLLLNGEPITRMDWDVSVHYRTGAEDWLAVEFDGTGSWRAHITRSNLAPGIHAATVRLRQGEGFQDVTVSLMVE